MSDLMRIFNEHQIEIIKDNLSPRPEGKVIRHDIFMEPVRQEVDWLKLAKLISGAPMAIDANLGDGPPNA